MEIQTEQGRLVLEVEEHEQGARGSGLGMTMRSERSGAAHATASIDAHLREDYPNLADVELGRVPATLSGLRNALPPPTYKYMTVLLEPAFTHVDPEQVLVAAMVRQLEAALSQTLEIVAARQHLIEQPDLLFENLSGSMQKILRGVVSGERAVVESARRRADAALKADEFASTSASKAASKEAKKLKAREAAAARRERMAAKKGKAGESAGAEAEGEEGLGSPTRSGDERLRSPDEEKTGEDIDRDGSGRESSS